MSLIYKFKKEKLEDGSYASRPRILVTLRGKNISIEVPALIDSGCDITVIPENIAKIIGLNREGEKSKLYAYRESTDVIQSKANITFLGKVARQTEYLNNVPVLISLSNNKENDDEIILGINGIFDAFDITFKKAQNKIIFKKTVKQIT